MSFETITGTIFCVVFGGIVLALLGVVAAGFACEILPVFMDVSGLINVDKCR